jgi:hypothetical protein
VIESDDPTPGKPGKASADFFREEYSLNYAIFTAKKPQVGGDVRCGVPSSSSSSSSSSLS